MEMKLRDEENISRGEAAASRIPVPSVSGDSGSAAAVVDHVREIPAQPAAPQNQPVIIQKISLDLLVPSPYNSRKFRLEQSIQDMAQSLREHGQREALRVYPGEGEYQGKFMIVSGVTRFLAAKSLNALEVSDWQTLDAIVDPNLNPNNPLALVIASRIHNSMSKETDMDHAATVADLEEQGYSHEEIMLAMGINASSRLYKLKLFKELPLAIFNIAALRPDKVTAEFAYILRDAVSSLGEEKATLLAEELIAKNLSKRKLIGRIKTERRKIENKPTRSTRERTALFYLGGTKIGNMRLMRLPNSTMRNIKLDVDIPDDDAQDLAIEIENLIQRVMGKC